MRGWQNRRTARTDRWKRENDAPRLKESIPHLASLRLQLRELSGGQSIAGTNRVRHFVVEQAAARFEIPCGDGKCEDGGHNLTDEILPQLQSRTPEFEGTSTCNGHVGDRPCDRQLGYSAEAKYDA